MSQQKLITVFGATGRQGGSVVRGILNSTKLNELYKIRAVTRDPTKPAAQSLKDLGVEVVAGDLDKPESVNEVVKGSDVVFGVTNFWESIDPVRETTQGKSIVSACKLHSVSRLIWSSLPNVSKLTSGKITGVAHFDSKAAVEEFAREQSVPSTFFMPAVFMSQITEMVQPNPDGSDSGLFFVPFDTATVKCAVIDPEADTGIYVAAVLLNLEKTLSIEIAATGEFMTFDEAAKLMTEVTGKKTSAMRITYEQFSAAMPPAAAEELTENFRLLGDFGFYCGGFEKDEQEVKKGWDLIESAGLRKPLTFKEFLEKK